MYCSKCEQHCGRDEEASLVDGKILCLQCSIDNKEDEHDEPFFSFAINREEVECHYDMHVDTDAWNKLDAFMGKHCWDGLNEYMSKVYKGTKEVE